MRYQLLGKSGLRVSELCLGTMTFGEDWGWGADKATCQAMFEAFAKEGGNFIDTSINYTNGTSEKIIGELIQSEREAFVIASKYTLRPSFQQGVKELRPNMVGNHRKNMMQAVERSLKRLKTDYLDILYLHAWDYTTPVEEVMRALDDLIRQGKVFYLAISDTPSWVIAEGNTRAELMGWTRFLGIQAPYSLLRRDLERDIMPMARYQDMTVLPWGILSAGILSGKFLKELDQPTRVNANVMDNLSPEKVAIVREVVALGDEIGKPASQVAINWVRQQQHRAQIIPIIGARNMSQLTDNLDVLNWKLSQEQLDRLDKISAIDLGFPWTFAYRNEFVYGETYDLIEHPSKLKQIPTVREAAAK